MDLTWSQIFGRSIIAIVALLVSIYVVKVTHGCKGKWYNVNYVLVAYMFVITLVVLKEADNLSGLGIKAKLEENKYMENYRSAEHGRALMGTGRNAEYYANYLA